MRFSELSIGRKIAALVLFFGIMALGAWLWLLAVHAMPPLIRYNLGWIVIVIGLVYLFVARRRRPDVEL